MRTIKFRAWEPDTEMGKPGSMSYDQAFCHSQIRTNDGIIIMQFTGLKDKNGKEIYEGDIVKSFWQHDGHINRDYNYEGIVSWGGENGEPCFYIYDKDGDSYQPFVSYDREELISIEVIGNIHEHSHLLK